MKELPPISILDRDEPEDEVPNGVVRAHELGHLDAIARFFPGVRAEIRGDVTVYVDGPNRIDLEDRDAVLRFAAVCLAGARAEAIWRRSRGLAMAIKPCCGFDRLHLRRMCAAGGYDPEEIEMKAWEKLAFD